jgi:hypothetical protein
LIDPACPEFVVAHRHAAMHRAEEAVHEESETGILRHQLLVQRRRGCQSAPESRPAIPRDLLE